MGDDQSSDRISDAPYFLFGCESDLPDEHTPGDVNRQGNHDARTAQLKKEEGKLDPSAGAAPSLPEYKEYQCLRPGALFKGVQRSGQKSYDVEVTILEVDFSASFLCGHLCFHGLVCDHPKVTTYFDAQIIGTQLGFVTQDDWRANRLGDLAHLSLFSAFHEVKKDLVEPNLLLPDNTSSPALFMRWKERYVVPEDGPQDLAGFYYVCIEFAPPPVYSNTPERSGATHFWNDDELSGNAPQAKICGYYHHPNSEPYQQLLVEYVGKKGVQSTSDAS